MLFTSSRRTACGTSLSIISGCLKKDPSPRDMLAKEENKKQGKRMGKTSQAVYN
jgi:hypothetical protein